MPTVAGATTVWHHCPGSERPLSRLLEAGRGQPACCARRAAGSILPTARSSAAGARNLRDSTKHGTRCHSPRGDHLQVVFDAFESARKVVPARGERHPRPRCHWPRRETPSRPLHRGGRPWCRICCCCCESNARRNRPVARAVATAPALLYARRHLTPGVVARRRASRAHGRRPRSLRRTCPRSLLL